MKSRLLAVFLCLSMLCGCIGCTPSSKTDPPQNDASSTTTESSSSGNATTAASSSPVNLIPNEENSYPYMGLTLRIPQKLLNAVLDNMVFMRSDDQVEYLDMGDGSNLPANWHPTPEHTLLHGGAFEFRYIPKQIRDRTPHVGMEKPMSYDEYRTWLPKTLPMAKIEMCRKDEFQKNTLMQNGYSHHKKLGETKDYIYHLSWNDATDDQANELFSILPDLVNNIAIKEPRKVDEQFFGVTTPEVKKVSQVGSFETTTLEGQQIDQTIFAEKKLTMVNIWTTWCGSCIDEMPELEKLAHDMKKMDVQLIGICTDISDSRGQINKELLALSQQITKKTGISFKTLVPDQSLHDGLLKGTLGYPTTFFIDRQGTIIGEPVLGAKTSTEWKDIVEERLAEVAQ